MRATGFVVRRAAVVLWASPWTLVGIAVGLTGILTGGRMRRGPGIVEFHGGAVRWLLNRLPAEPIAMTLGHIVLGLNQDSLDLAQPHELVHVRQYERWGPLFIPAYLGCWIALWLVGRDGYRDNPFEVEAYDEHP